MIESKPHIPQGDEPTWLCLAKFWLLADTIEDNKLERALSDMIVDKFNQKTDAWSAYPDGFENLVAAVDYTFAARSGPCTLKDMFADMFYIGSNRSEGGGSGFFGDALHKISGEVLVDFSKRWLRSTRTPPSDNNERPFRELKKTNYHPR